MQFSDLSLSEPILRALEAEGYATATPIQAQAIPHVLAGRNLVGCAQTGTGKTAAFALPTLHRLSTMPRRNAGSTAPRCLILSPTRELAAQIANSFRAYGRDLRLRYSVIFGGVNQHGQVQSLRSGIDVVIATPGRLLDLKGQGHVDLSQVEVLVLDEADRMLDMGFINDIRKLVAAIPNDRQTLLFSATMPPEIRKLAEAIVPKAVNVQVTPVSSTVEKIEQSVYFVDKHDKPALLAHLVEKLPMFRAIVFTRTKHGADKVVRHLRDYGIESQAIHGNKSQNQRKRALADFSKSKYPVLVATDIASRGIDIDGITHVVNFDLTHEPETYVHRIGRTARAGAEGSAVSFCDRDERQNLRAIERLIKRQIEVKVADGQAVGRAPKGASDESHERRAPQGNWQHDRRERRAPRAHVQGDRQPAQSHPAAQQARHHAHPRPHEPGAGRPQHQPSHGGGQGRPQQQQQGGHQPQRPKHGKPQHPQRANGGGGGGHSRPSHPRHPLAGGSGARRFGKSRRRQHA